MRPESKVALVFDESQGRSIIVGHDAPSPKPQHINRNFIADVFGVPRKLRKYLCSKSVAQARQQAFIIGVVEPWKQVFYNRFYNLPEMSVHIARQTDRALRARAW
jgi:hypothetical protein